MQVLTGAPVTGLIGHSAGSPYTMSMRGRLCIARAFVSPANPQTADQVAVRSHLTAATRNWDTLSAAQRTAWDAYAAAHYPSTAGKKPITGLALYVKVQSYRLAQGLALSSDAPTTEPPVAPSALTAGAATSDTEYVFTLTHDLSSVVGMKVLWEITAETASVARKPRDPDLRMIKHVAPDSFVAAAASGMATTIAGGRFAVGDGKRYGVRARFVSAEGVPGLAVKGDFIRTLA